MKSIKTLFLMLAVSPLLVLAQQINTPAPSPAAKLEQAVGLIQVTVEYSRPGVKGRTIFGGLEPYDAIWRTGANSATKITFSGDIKINGKDLKAGSYALLSKPGKTQWEVYFYPYETGNFGSYIEKTPLLTATVEPKTLSSLRETFTIDVNTLKNDGGTLELSWEKTKISIPFEVDTKTNVLSQIERFEKNQQSTLANNYHTMASYLLSEKENLPKALEFATKACDLNTSAYWMMRTKSLIQAELGKYKEAIESAKLSREAADKAGNQQYVRFNDESIKEWSSKK